MSCFSLETTVSMCSAVFAGNHLGSAILGDIFIVSAFDDKRDKNYDNVYGK